ncbi:DUF6207 family protein [Streptomyces sp. NBC_01267]|uniref:DUF6207 family protein n=1 Tax=unclassified Streptomyces TaxID=2593676 RepID=UPI002DD9EE99|nr:MULTISPECIES: DUF6207 family protein [unclassified Streptomyces]WSC24994.1 DUF6207 family protein [Streptomyces sp. NBC_01766]
MDKIDAQHVAEPGLVVLDITAADESTALQTMTELSQLWATSGVSPVQRTPGEPGIHTRLYANLRHYDSDGTQDPTP